MTLPQRRGRIAAGPHRRPPAGPFPFSRSGFRGVLAGMSEDEDDLAGSETNEPVVLEISDSLDLHHFVPGELLDIVDAYLDAALDAGFTELRLIHGRGKGVQRARVRGFLAGDDRIERFEEAPPGRGGWGATLVWLRARARS